MTAETIATVARPVVPTAFGGTWLQDYLTRQAADPLAVEPRTEPVTDELVAAQQSAAEHDALWLQSYLLDPVSPNEVLRFMRFRPQREIELVLAASQVAGFRGAAETCQTILDGMIVRRQGRSDCPEGYLPVPLPVDLDERDEYLATLVSWLKTSLQPGAARGWSWDVTVDVDEAAGTVHASFSPNAPR